MTLPDLSLKGRAAIVTGAASPLGIGWATALTLAEAGAHVAVCDIVRQDGGIDTLAQEVRELGRRSIAVQADVTKKADVDNLVAQAVREFGFVDILVNCAGGGPKPPGFLDMPEEYWDRLFGMNLKGSFLCSQAVARVMVQRRKGAIINISSTGSQLRGGVSAYGSAKAALNRLTTGMAHDLAGHNIRVNAIAPGMVRTELLREALGDIIDDPAQMKEQESRIPLGHVCEPADIAALALFLASDASRLITGTVIAVDGGDSLVRAGRH